MPKTALPLVACLLALAAADASAQSFWKWRDSSGSIHLSDTPPPASVQAKDVLQRPAGGSVPAPAPTTSTGVGIAPSASAPSGDGELQKKKARADKEAAEKAAADKAEAERKTAVARADNCSRAQVQAKALQSGVRIARMNANGEREFMDDNARAAELRRAQDIAAQNCGNPPPQP